MIEEKIPRYKLRIDTTTGFTGGDLLPVRHLFNNVFSFSNCPGYQHNDWLIKTPIIDLDAPIDLNPVLLRETLNYFILSGERLSQMTKVYNDVDALTKLLEEVHSLFVLIFLFLSLFCFVLFNRRSEIWNWRHESANHC